MLQYRSLYIFLKQGSYVLKLLEYCLLGAPTCRFISDID